MTTKNPTSKTVFAKLIEPLTDIIEQANYKRKCKALSDRLWIETGLMRIISQEDSGRAFLQKLIDSEKPIISRSHFFETLKSKRRLKLCQEVSSALYKNTREINYTSDPFAGYVELDEYDIFAGDGHFHAAAVHDQKKFGKKYPTQHFFAIDLRSHALRHLTLADTSGNRKREHDTRALKRLDMRTLRQSAPKGRKVIYVWDRAAIDFMQWFRWKHAGGIYFVSREKKNMDPMVIADLPFDRSDPINAGVQRYELVGCSAGVTMHRITYECPISGKTYRFVTSLTNVAPGLIAYLYKTRWDIEKIFDQVKNKFAEKKAWATSDTAKTMQAQFICMAHNLMQIFDDCLRQEGIDNENENRRRRKRLNKALSGLDSSQKNNLPDFLASPKRASQLSVKYVRWLRNNLFANTSWRNATGSLRRIYAVF